MLSQAISDGGPSLALGISPAGSRSSTPSREKRACWGPRLAHARKTAQVRVLPRLPCSLLPDRSADSEAIILLQIPKPSLSGNSSSSGTATDKSSSWKACFVMDFWKSIARLEYALIDSEISSIEQRPLPRGQRHFFFSSASQFVTSVMGSDVEGCKRLLIRKRCPSGDTSKVQWGEGRVCV